MDAGEHRRTFPSPAAASASLLAAYMALGNEEVPEQPTDMRPRRPSTELKALEEVLKVQS